MECSEWNSAGESIHSTCSSCSLSSHANGNGKAGLSCANGSISSLYTTFTTVFRVVFFYEFPYPHQATLTLGNPMPCSTSIAPDQLTFIVKPKPMISNYNAESHPTPPFCNMCVVSNSRTRRRKCSTKAGVLHTPCVDWSWAQLHTLYVF